jgi:hypothetical protein
MRDLTGQRFGRWIVLHFAGKTGRKYRWTCRCDCGVEKHVIDYHLTMGKTHSCGCLTAEKAGQTFRTHGLSDTPEHITWLNIRQRCLNPTHKKYKYYGGRGITVCDRWRHSFENFLSDMGPRPTPKHSAERINNNRGYEPGNVKWATKLEQANNTRSNHFLTIDGQTKTIAEWSRVVGISQLTIARRIHIGWSDEDAVKSPLHTWRFRKPLGQRPHPKQARPRCAPAIPQ